jgi:signal transduction histidine kinase
LEENINLNNPISKRKEIQIIDNLEENTICFIDKEQVNLVFRNILNNAIKFTNKGGQIFVSSKKNSDNFWEISIKDNGIGMKKETIQNLFSLNLTGKQQYGTEGEKGTGLGLQLTKDFVLKNGGDLRVNSEKGEGTTFTIILPAG